MLCFAHISDLHFGDKLANRDAGVPLQRPHDTAKCLALPAGINLAMDEAQMPDGAELRFVVSGDVSVSGSTGQLAVAHAFIRSEVSISRLPAPFGVMDWTWPVTVLAWFRATTTTGQGIARPSAPTTRVSSKSISGPVSYTHLRAH